MEWSLEPGVIAWLLLAELLYLRALRVLRRRGVEVGLAQKLAWHAGLALQVVGLLSPIDSLGEDLLSAHMAQHLLIADLGAPLLLAGARNPVLMFLLPRSALVALARRERLRRAFRGHFTPAEHRGVEVPGIYWHFVDIMWIVVYVTIYLV